MEYDDEKTNRTITNSPRKYYEGLKKEYVRCGLCGSNRKKYLNTGDRYGMGLRTVYCKKCGLIFTDPRPVQKEMEQFYRRTYRLYYESAEKPTLEYIEKGGFEKRAAKIYWTLKGNIDFECVQSIMDIGCSEGSLLRTIGIKQPHIQRFGIEPSLAFSRFAAEYSSSKVFTGNLNEYIKIHNDPKELFDIIILSHVFEHFLLPSKELEKVWKLLKPGGFLYIEVPNMASILCNPDMLHIAHLYHFCPETLRLILLKQGFQPIYSEEEGLAEKWTMCMLGIKSQPAKITLPSKRKIKSNVEFVKTKISKKVQKDNFVNKIISAKHILLKYIRG